MLGATLTVRSVTKRFGPVTALRDVGIEFSPGQIHAVVGANGAGKSTLMGILAGFVEPTSGEVLLDGQTLPTGRPFECRRKGVGMVHQHFTLVQEFTVEENLALSQVDSPYGGLDLDALSRPALAIAENLNWRIDPHTAVKNLPVGTQQRIEILKVLASDAKVSIFDEPTAVLAGDEVEDLLHVLRRLRDEGRTVILIAHKLREVLAVADRITVLRRGQIVASVNAGETDETKLAEWMVGELPATLTNEAGAVSPALEVRNLKVRGDRGNMAVDGISFAIGSGEVLGIGGVDGNGQIELAEALAGVRGPSAGALNWNGRPLDEGTTIGYVPQDRQREGLALRMSVQDNLLIGALHRPELTAGPLLKQRVIANWAVHVANRYSIKSGSLSDPVESLSGGNQQKVVVGRVLDGAPDLLVVVNPTRGLDVQATDFVHRQILAAKESGAAVALFSADLDELAALADRSLFMSSGRLHEAAGAQSVVGGSR